MGIVYLVIFLLIFALLLRISYYSLGGNIEIITDVVGKRSSKILLYNSKGVIYDRNLIALSGNQSTKYLLINPRGFNRENIRYICDIANISPDDFETKLNKETPFVLKTNVQPKNINGVFVFDGTKRYPDEMTNQHIIGYLDKANQIGVSGIEKAYNDELSLYANSVYVNYSSDAAKGILGGLGFNTNNTLNDSKNGIVLTLDSNLSKKAENIMSKYIDSGALVIMDVDSGEVLTMTSYPKYDVNNIQSYINSENGELINNAVSNQVVGSVFKIIVATCAVVNNIENFEFECSGSIAVDGRNFSCQNGKKHGKQNLTDAFANSCNCYFISIGQLLGYEKIIEIAQLFGVDSKIKLCKEMYSASGVLPKEKDNLEIANLSIGQGKLLISPLQVCRITAAISNGGYLVNPTIYLGSYFNENISNKPSYKYKTQIVAENQADKIKEMCLACVEKGTGKNAKPDLFMAGGKTASAQTGIYNSENDEILNTYFTGFYPYENPEYAITVFAKNGKSGSETCAPVFKEICDYISQNY